MYEYVTNRSTSQTCGIDMWQWRNEGDSKTIKVVVGMIERILIVDDELDICFVLKKVLSENGFVVDSCQLLC